RFQLQKFIGIEPPSTHVELGAKKLIRGRVMFERLARAEYEQQPLRIPFAFDAFLFDQFRKEGSRGIEKRLDRRSGGEHVTRIAFEREAEEPAEMGECLKGSNLERRVPLKECFERGPDGAGRRERQNVAGANVTAVGVRAAAAELAAVQDRDGTAGLGQVIGA